MRDLLLGVTVCVLTILSSASLVWSGEQSEPLASSSGSPIPSPTPTPTASNTQVYAGPHREFIKALQPLPEIKLKPVPRLIGPEEVESGPLLVTLEDLAGVSLLGADGKVRIAHAGDALEMGDSFQTGERGSARVAFEKGVQVLCPPGVILHLDQESIAGPAGGIDVPMVEVEQGEVRILVESASAAAGSEDEKVPRPLKLIVRTKAAVMGVRGTDFLVSATDDHADLKMVSGTVEIATDSHALGMGQSIRAGASESAELVHGRPLPRPEHYEAGMELHDFHDRHVRLEQMWNEAVRDAKSHRLGPQFLAIRNRKADALNLSNGYAPKEVRLQAKQAEEEEERKQELRKSGVLGAAATGTSTPKKKHRRRRHGKAAPVAPPSPDSGESSK